MNKIPVSEITQRYAKLANDNCCISCGNAINYANIKKGEICIDIGSGRGTDCIKMSIATGDNGFVYGIDITDQMIITSQNLASKMNLNNIKFIKSTIEKINLPDQIADVIISNCTINHSIDKLSTYNEIYRILKKNGRIIISDIYALEPIPPEFHNDPVAISECWGGAITKEEYLEILNKVEFKNIKILEESKPYTKSKVLISSFTFYANK